MASDLVSLASSGLVLLGTAAGRDVIKMVGWGGVGVACFSFLNSAYIFFLIIIYLHLFLMINLSILKMAYSLVLNVERV